MALMNKNIAAVILGSLLLIGQCVVIKFGFLCPSLIVRILFGLLIPVFTSIGLFFLYLSTFTLPSIDPLSQDAMRLFTTLIFWQLAKSHYQKLQNRCKVFDAVQHDFLLNLLKENKDTEYGQEHEFEEIKSVDDYQLNHPVTTYLHVKSYIQREAQGEEKVLLNERPVMMALTSGTTGDIKMFPRSASRRKMFFRNFTVLLEILRKSNRYWNPLQKICVIYTHFPEKYTDGGVRFGPSSMMLKLTKQTCSNYSTPVSGFKLTNEVQALYVHALFALRERNLGGIMGNFISAVLKIFTTIETNQEQLLVDIRNGTLNPDLDLPGDIRSELEKALYPLPERAAELEVEFKKGFQGVTKRIWPHMQIIFGVTGGSMAVYRQRLSKRYTEDILLYSSFLICTEGFLGINMWPDAEGPPSYVLCPDALFYEFIPVAEGFKEHPKVLLAENLEVGQNYQILLTNTEGLYRIALDDVFKVVGFWHKAPIVQFEYRIGEMFNLGGKKFPETVFKESVSSAVESVLPSVELLDYACCESLLYHEIEGQVEGDVFDFVVFVELSEVLDRSAQKKLESQMNANLAEQMSCAYSSDRHTGGRIQLILVKPSTFESFLQLILSTTDAAPSQIKVPRKLRKAHWVKFLLEYKI